MIKFFIPGVPVPQGRPRFSRQGNHVRVHTDPKTRKWRDVVRWASIKFRPSMPLEGPLNVHLRFQMPRPKSLPKKVIHHIKKPDIDNLAKAVVDSLADARLFNNDSQIVYKTIRKVYSDKPGVDVTIIPET